KKSAAATKETYKQAEALTTSAWDGSDVGKPLARVSGGPLAPKGEAASEAVEDGHGVVDLQEAGEEEVDDAGRNDASKNTHRQQRVDFERTLAVDAAVGDNPVHDGIAYQGGQRRYQTGGKDADSVDEERSQIKAVQPLVQQQQERGCFAQHPNGPCQPQAAQPHREEQNAQTDHEGKLAEADINGRAAIA